MSKAMQLISSSSVQVERIFDEVAFGSSKKEKKIKIQIKFIIKGEIKKNTN